MPAAGWSASLQAATTTTFQVSAQITAGCQVNNGAISNPSFGTLDFGSHPATETGTADASLSATSGITISCTPGVNMSMTVGSGQNYGTARNMAYGSNLIPYRIYRDAGFASEYAPASSYAISYTDPDNIVLPIFAVATLSGSNPPGVYQDTVTVTLSW
ncbi:hypothetical protein BTH42_05515 [Burkholderia sp. SRS-W-2-2016]|nr:hypothetical protein BTH42_05515 [Burkholderia sp. SRS-W-2-2016]